MVVTELPFGRIWQSLVLDVPGLNIFDTGNMVHTYMGHVEVLPIFFMIFFPLIFFMFMS